jgi:AraC family transcriptional regulator
MKYREAGLLRSSAERGWVGLAAELRTHASGLILEQKASAHTELAIAVEGSAETVIRRRSGKILDECAAALGTVWLCPAGTREEFVETSALTPILLHIFMPIRAFEGQANDNGRGVDAFGSLRYERAFQDPLIVQCGLAIAQELKQETSAGRMLVEAVGNTIAARLIYRNTGRAPEDVTAAGRSQLDPRRLKRVLEAVDARLEENLSLAYLASVACLSQCHFARVFKTSMELSPHQYVSRRRLEHAKDRVAAGTTPLSQIAASLGFSSQANFNRAFKAATGVTPTAYKLSVAD